MHIRKLDTTRKQDVTQFVQFPFELYRENRCWVPPIVSDMRSILNQNKHPFYQHSAADFFVVEQNGKTLGRMAMLVNRNFNRYQERNAAFFGYYEVVEDSSASQLLFDATLTWAHENKLDEIIGPRGVIGIDGSVLVEGFEYRPAIGIPYNLPYYDQFIKNAGFVKDADYLSGYIHRDQDIGERVHRIVDRIKRRRGFTIKTFDSKRELRQWIPRALQVHEAAMGQLHSFYPPTKEETMRVINALMTISDPSLIKLVLKGEAVVGFILGYPDISAALQRINGRLWLTGWIHALREQRQTRWANINGLGMLPAYQGLGGNALLYAELQKTIQASRYEHLEVVQVNETNFKSKSDMESIGVKWTKRHRHYKRSV